MDKYQIIKLINDCEDKQLLSLIYSLLVTNDF